MATWPYIQVEHRGASGDTGERWETQTRSLRGLDLLPRMNKRPVLGGRSITHAEEMQEAVKPREQSPGIAWRS
jgi:hypothetical protein